MSRAPEVGVVFVSTNEGGVLVPAIESLFDSGVTRTLEVVVVDNDSSDGAAAEIARRWPQVRILRRDRRYGLPANLNHGIRATTAPYVMLCNSDLIFGPGAVDRLAEFLETHPTAGIAAPKLLSPEGERRISARRWYTLRALLMLRSPIKKFATTDPAVLHNIYADWDYREPMAVDWVPCPATMMRRAALEEVGLMDERFRLYFDDVDISLRMHQAGWEVWCVPFAEIVHLEQRASVRPLTRAWRWHLASLIKFWWKHKGLRPKRGLTS